MKISIFGLTISSSWGNGHATLWRGLVRALTRRGHRVAFFERDVPYYAQNRDMAEIPGGDLVLYRDWDEVRAEARRHLADSDVAVVTSYCPDGIAASDLVLSSPAACRVFYDLDTPVTLARLAAGEPVPYLPPQGLRDFCMVLSYTGGGALAALRTRLGARRVLPLYGHVDPEVHRPVARSETYGCALSYMGTYAADRQSALEDLLVEPARLRPHLKFLIGGAQYPQDFPWTENIWFVKHLPPEEHPAFFSSSRLTLNVTRRAMAEMGWCPSGRLFEAAACGCPVLSDRWEGLEEFFAPGEEILVARSTQEALAALDLSDAEIVRIAQAARERTLRDHSSDRRAEDLLRALDTCFSAAADIHPPEA
jgi:spore maturation protein CgeB